jgi:hypothetical protein
MAGYLVEYAMLAALVDAHWEGRRRRLNGGAQIRAFTKTRKRYRY